MRTTILSIMAICASHFLHAQGVGINTLKPDPSAALDIVSDNKGLLIPRVALKSLTDGKTIDKPAHSLLVYNLNAQLPGGEGYYFNAGTNDFPDWIQIAIKNPKQQDIAFRAIGLVPGQVIQPSTSAKVLFSKEQYDTGGHYDETSSPQGSSFKAPVNGIYHFDAHFCSNPSSICDILLVKEKNGVVTTLVHRRFGYDPAISADVMLEKDDIVYVLAANNYVSLNTPVTLEWYLGFSTFDGFFNGRLILSQ